MCADPDSARARATRATERLRDIAWDRQRERYLSLVDELTGRAPGGRAPADAPADRGLQAAAA